RGGEPLRRPADRAGRRGDDLRRQLCPASPRGGAEAEGGGRRPRGRLRPLPAQAGPLVRWLLATYPRGVHRSPLVTGLRFLYPTALGVLIGLAISRSPEKPRVAFLNEIPAGTGLSLGAGGFSQNEARRQLCAKVECVDASSRAEVEQKVKDGDV